MIDGVVEWQAPTPENNYTWYRRYASDWVEQGGIYANPAGGGQTVNLAVEMADSNYSVWAHAIATAYTSNSSETPNKNTVANYASIVYAPTTTSFGLRGTSEVSITRACWEVKGFAAKK